MVEKSEDWNKFLIKLIRENKSLKEAKKNTIKPFDIAKKLIKDFHFLTMKELTRETMYVYRTRNQNWIR